MITTFALFAVLHQTSLAQTMTLKLTPGAKHVYQLITASRVLGLDASGDTSLSFTKKDATSYTVSWPLTEFTATKGNFRPMPASSLAMSDTGRILAPDSRGAMAMFLCQMALPDAPISVGGTFKIKHNLVPTVVDFNGKLDKVIENGAIAVIVADGKLAAQGSSIDLRWESHFDIKKGLFRSSTMTMTPPGGQTPLSTFGFKLVK